MSVLDEDLDNFPEAFQTSAGPHGQSLDELRHDLRQPLMAVRLLVDTMVSTTPVPPEAAAMLDRVQQQTDWMLLLLDSGLDRQPDVSIVDLADIVHSPCLATPTGAPYREHVHARRHVTVLADPVGLRRVVWNLLENARRAVSTGGEVEVRVRHRGRHAFVEVADDGPGFGHLTPQHGLGLVGVRHFAERFGGELSIGASSLGGALVTLRLPLMPSGDVHCGR